MTSKKTKESTRPYAAALDQLRSAWFVLAAAAGIIYWAAKHDSSLGDIKDNRNRIGTLENRIVVLESGLDKLQMKIDGIKEDLTMIKKAVIK
jgi:hypothetical protein